MKFETAEEFERKKTKTLEILGNLAKFLDDGRNLGVDIDDQIIEKVIKAKEEAGNERLKVALIGGFSSGKTSIVAAWTEKYDKASMKINIEESSDAVITYNCGEFDIVDTPGLFGFKEDSQAERYQDKTLKYVSEAHLVLFVTEPTNPIPASHKALVRQLFAEDQLNILPRTVFVISRFDEVADLEDEAEYQERLATLQDNIKKRLEEFELKQLENLSIVGVSANPFGEGIDYWLNHLDEFKKLSRIGTLQVATVAKMKEAGGNDAIIAQTKASIVRDLLIKHLPKAKQGLAEAQQNAVKLSNLYSDSVVVLDKFEKNARNSRQEFIDFFMTYFSDLILQLNGTSPETFNDFFERNIGKDSIILETNLNRAFSTMVSSLESELRSTAEKIGNNFNQYEDVMQGYLKSSIKGGGTVLNSGVVSVTSDMIKAGRDILLKSLKFKPWQAVKLANFINAALPIVGSLFSIGMDILDDVQKAQREEKFRQQKASIQTSFEKMREGYLLDMKDPAGFITEYMPHQYANLKKALDNFKSQLDEAKTRDENFKDWYAQALTIEEEFKKISS